MTSVSLVEYYDIAGTALRYRSVSVSILISTSLNNTLFLEGLRFEVLFEHVKRFMYISNAYPCAYYFVFTISVDCYRNI